MSTVNTLNIFHITTRKAFYLALAALVIISSMYIGLINKTVMNVVTRERMQKEIAAISTSIGDLEFQYINLKNAVTLDLAYEKGFEPASPSMFLARGATIPSLSYNYSR